MNMIVSHTLLFHVVGGSLALLSGAAASLSRKGSRSHQVSGNVFFVSMLGMAASGAYVAHMQGETFTFCAGVFTCYLVATAWMTVRRKAGETGLFEYGAMLIAISTGVVYVNFGFEAMKGNMGDYPAGFFFLWAAIAIFAAVMDMRMIKRGGVSGAQRIVRHLWRMCLALLIAAASFFLGQQDVFPEPVREIHILALPVIAVLVLMIYWLIRVGLTGWYRKASSYFHSSAKQQITNSHQEEAV